MNENKFESRSQKEVLVVLVSFRGLFREFNKHTGHFYWESSATYQSALLENKKKQLNINVLSSFNYRICTESYMI